MAATAANVTVIVLRVIELFLPKKGCNSVARRALARRHNGSAVPQNLQRTIFEESAAYARGAIRWPRLGVCIYIPWRRSATTSGRRDKAIRSRACRIYCGGGIGGPGRVRTVDLFHAMEAWR